MSKTQKPHKTRIELKVARTRARLTQAQLADKAGISRRTYRLVECGESDPTIRVAAQICKALGESDLRLFDPDI